MLFYNMLHNPHHMVNRRWPRVRFVVDCINCDQGFYEPLPLFAFLHCGTLTLTQLRTVTTITVKLLLQPAA